MRELHNAVESATVLANNIIEPIHLPATVTQTRNITGKGGGHQAGLAEQAGDTFEQRLKNFEMWEKLDVPKTGDIDERLQQLEKEILISALKNAGGVQVTAAKLLGIKERSLWHRIKKFKIDINEFKKQNKQ